MLGTSISDAWVYVRRFLGEEVNNSNSSKEPTVDLPYQRFFWRHLRHVSNLSFFHQDQLAIVEKQLKDNGAEEEDKVWYLQKDNVYLID